MGSVETRSSSNDSRALSRKAGILSPFGFARASAARNSKRAYLKRLPENARGPRYPIVTGRSCSRLFYIGAFCAIVAWVLRLRSSAVSGALQFALGQLT